MPSRVTPRGFIEAASTALPRRVLLTSSQSRPMTSQQTAAVKNSLEGVRTPRKVTTPSTIGLTVLALLVKRYATSSWMMIPQSSVAVRMKISFSASTMRFERWIGRTVTKYVAYDRTMPTATPISAAR